MADFEESSALGPPLFTWSDCDPAKAPPNEYIVDGLIRRRGSNLILSPPKKGKSQLVAQVVACLASGEPVFGFYGVDPSFEPRVLLLLTEETRFKARARIEANLRGLGYSDAEMTELCTSFEERLVVSARDRSRSVEDMIFSVERHSDWLLNEVREGRFNVVVLDSLRPAHGFEENSSTDMRPVTDLIRELSELGCGLIVHHAGHAHPDFARTGGDAARGSSDLDAARDTAVHIRHGKFGDSLLIGFHHRDDAERCVAVRTIIEDDRQVVRWERLGESEDPGTAKTVLQESELLARVQGAERVEDLPSLSDAKRLLGDEYRTVVGTMEQEGQVVGREFKNGQPGANPTLLMRPRQFSDAEWAEAEKRAQAGS